MIDDGKTICDDKGMTEVFNDCFASVFAPNDGAEIIPPRVFTGENCDRLSSVEITAETVYKKLLNLNSASAPGPDGMHPRVLKECSLELSLPLAMIFQKSLDDGALPSEWKRSNITPIFKKGKRNIASNYRPINLISVPCKIMESILKDNIMSHDTLTIKQAHHTFTARIHATKIMYYKST